MTAPAKRLTDQQVDQAIATALDDFIDALDDATAQCDWTTSRLTRINRVRLAACDEIEQLMRYREPRD